MNKLTMILCEKSSDIEKVHGMYRSPGCKVKRQGNLVTEIEHEDGTRYLFRCRGQMPHAALGLRLKDYVILYPADEETKQTLHMRTF
jgi:hypothetical protein